MAAAAEYERTVQGLRRRSLEKEITVVGSAAVAATQVLMSGNAMMSSVILISIMVLLTDGPSKQESKEAMSNLPAASKVDVSVYFDRAVKDLHGDSGLTLRRGPYASVRFGT